MLSHCCITLITKGNRLMTMVPLAVIQRSAFSNTMYRIHFLVQRKCISSLSKYITTFQRKRLYLCASSYSYICHSFNQEKMCGICHVDHLQIPLLTECTRRSCGTHDKNIKQERIRGVLQGRKERCQILLKDIRDTKNKMKVKMEEVIERENVWTIPNLLCVSRIAISPYLGYVITQSNFHLALGLFIFAGISDLIDGWIARTYPSQATKIGSFLDPMADKVLVAILFLTLTYMDFIPVVLTGMIIFRDMLLVAAGFYIRYQSLPAPKTLSRYFDVTHATAQLAPTFISKVNTAIQLSLIATTLAAPVFDYVDHPFIHALWYVTAATTVASAGSYVFSQNTYRYLKPKK